MLGSILGSTYLGKIPVVFVGPLWCKTVNTLSTKPISSLEVRTLGCRARVVRVTFMMSGLIVAGLPVLVGDCAFQGFSYFLAQQALNPNKS